MFQARVVLLSVLVHTHNVVIDVVILLLGFAFFFSHRPCMQGGKRSALEWRKTVRSNFQLEGMKQARHESKWSCRSPENQSYDFHWTVAIFFYAYKIIALPFPVTRAGGCGLPRCRALTWETPWGGGGGGGGSGWVSSILKNLLQLTWYQQPFSNQIITTFAW